MIGRLKGRCIAEDPPGRLVVDIGGVGYEVIAPLGSAERALQKDGSSVFIVHTHVREDSFELFGFATESERHVFRLLINVPNVGPKTALSILSALPPAELGKAVRGGNLKRLQSIPAIGKKTAERIILELKEKLPPDQLTDDTGERPAVAEGGDKLARALISMGYKPAEAERALRHLGDSVQTQPIADSLREALALLTR